MGPSLDEKRSCKMPAQRHLGIAKLFALPIGSLVVPLWDHLIGL